MSGKSSKTLSGKLTAFFETGTEGVIWAFEEDGKQGYDGLHCLKKGDVLRVFNDAAERKVIFEKAVDFEYERRRTPHPMNPQYEQQEVFGMWVHGFQQGEDPETWAKMFLDEKPAQLIPHVPPQNRASPERKMK